MLVLFHKFVSTHSGEHIHLQQLIDVPACPSAGMAIELLNCREPVSAWDQIGNEYTDVVTGTRMRISRQDGGCDFDAELESDDELYQLGVGQKKRSVKNTDAEQLASKLMWYSSHGFELSPKEIAHSVLAILGRQRRYDSKLLKRDGFVAYDDEQHKDAVQKMLKESDWKRLKASLPSDYFHAACRVLCPTSPPQ